MFDEFIRELDQLGLSQGVKVPIDLPLDDKGYFDRKCPHVECRADFKVLFDDCATRCRMKRRIALSAGPRMTRLSSIRIGRIHYIQEVGEAGNWCCRTRSGTVPCCHRN